ncbi:MAG: hypothetical protein MI919_31865 [Holophagales bacterium]|nr:hypothetical protein [Holophagales bacterium]
MRALLDPAVRLEGPLYRARFTLDGLPVEVAGQTEGGSRPAEEWSKGRAVEREELLGEHELCVQLGRPTQKGEATLEVPLRLTLLESPYDDFRVVEPFVFKIQVARPGVLERWRSLLLLSLSLLGLLLAAWYLRDRPDLPEDLRVAFARDPDAAGAGELSLEPRPLGAAPAWAPWLGWVAKRPLRTPGEERLLGWIHPDRHELFRLVPAPGVRVGGSEAAGSEAGSSAVAGGSESVEAGRAYRLHTEEGDLIVRVEYES